MSVKEFITKYKIKPALAAGLKSHLRAEDNTDMPETDLINQYRDFSGVQLTSGIAVKTDAVAKTDVAEIEKGRSLSGVEGLPVENAIIKKEKK